MNGYINRNHHRLYVVWKGIKARCYSPNNPNYYLYGAKGIRMCDEWKNFDNFCEWAFASGYDESAGYGKCTINRIDNAGNYEPSNCEWSDSLRQSRNRSANVILTHNGKTQLATDWARELDIPLSTISTRLKRGWSVERALSQQRWIRGDSPR